MRFVYPEFLWALTALAVPIVIHLFNFRRYKTLYFSSLQFVRHIEQRSKSTQRLRNILVLLARMLAFTALIIAFAQPYFPRSNAHAAKTKEVLAIHIDNSFSMTMKGAEGELLSEAKESARKLLMNAPLDARILLSTNLLDGVESRVTTKIEALDRIDKIQPSPMSRSFDEVIKWQKNYLANYPELDKTGRIQHVYLSDFQKKTTRFTTLQPDSTAVYVPILLKAQQSANISVDSVWFTSPLHKTGVNKELNVKLTNHSSVPLQNVELQFSVEQTTRDLFVDIPAQESVSTVINYTDKEAGIKTGKIVVQDKQFYSDDEYFFSYEVAKTSPVLVINGSSAASSVARIYRLDDFYSVREIEQGHYTQDQLNGVNLVILNGVSEIPSGLTANLTEFVENGGTVALFPGKDPKFSSLNAFLNAVRMPVLNKEINQSSRIQTINYKDPFFKGVFEKEKENLSLPGVSRFFLTASSSSNQALDIVELQNGKPLLIRSDGNRSVYLYTSVLSPEYGSFTADILYTTILLRIGERSLRNTPLSITIGESPYYPVYDVARSEQPIRLQATETDFIPRSEVSGNTVILNLSGTEALEQLKAGIYTISNGSSLGKMAVNYSRAESDIAQFSDEEIQSALTEAGILNTQLVVLDQGASSVELNLDKPYPYWKIFIALAIACILAELLILKLWTGTRGN